MWDPFNPVLHIVLTVCHIEKLNTVVNVTHLTPLKFQLTVYTLTCQARGLLDFR